MLQVCYVTNYSNTKAPGGDPQASIMDAEGNKSPIAAVAMVGMGFGGLVSLPNGLWYNYPFVYFMVFAQPNDPNIDDFVLQTNAVLDSGGKKAVPGVCIACHGGTYNGTVHGVSKARFLPFDQGTFLYDQSNASFSEGAQFDVFRKLNQVARAVDTEGPTFSLDPGFSDVTSQTILDLINGWYDWCNGVNVQGCFPDETNHPFVPGGVGACTTTGPATCGWDTANLAGVYRFGPRQLCRTCHIAHSDVFNVENFASFSESATRACSDINSDFMPFAEVPFNRLWAPAVSIPPYGVIPNFTQLFMYLALSDAGDKCTFK